MKIDITRDKLINRFIIYVAISVILGILSYNAPLIAIGDLLYSVFICIILIIYCISLSKKELLYFCIIFMLFYTWIIEIFIHYLNINVNIEFEYCTIIPIMVLFARTTSKIYITEATLFIYFIIYLAYSIVLGNNAKFAFISSLTYITSLLVYTAIRHYYISAKTMFNLYTFLYAIATPISILQFVLGFNEDTRNAFFGVFGLGQYCLFLLIMPLKAYGDWVDSKISTIKLIIISLYTFGIFTITENKAAVLVLAIDIIVLTAYNKKINVKRIKLLAIIITSIPILFNTYLLLNQKWNYIRKMSINEYLYDYFFKNNNWDYKYSRFDSLAIIVKSINLIAKVFGKGIGASTPLNTVFYNDANIKEIVPYYIEIYGKNHGYQLTSISTFILDFGFIGLILFFTITAKEIFEDIKTAKRAHNTSKYILFGIIPLLIYNTIYGNIANYKSLAIDIAIYCLIKNLTLRKNNELNTVHDNP